MTEIARLAGLSASAIGRALAGGEASPVALAEFLLSRIAAQGSPVFLQVTAERALEEAGAAERRLKAGRPLSPLDGVPIAWKDLVDMKGEVTTAGSETRRHAPPALADAPIVAHATAAGMVSLGKLNLTEFAYSGIGLNPHFGTPLNPNSETPRAPGGSSSGSGVAVAAGLAPCAIGTDTGGSVRIPAAFNGVVGYKSSAGRIDKAGVFPLSETLDTVGPLARSVEDCVHLDAVLRGAVASPVRRQALDGLAVFVPETLVLDDLDGAVAANFEASLAALAAAGMKVSRGPMPELAAATALFEELGTLIAAEAYAVHHALIEGPDAARVDRRVVARMMKGSEMSAHDLIRLHRARAGFIADIRARLGDALIAMPTTPLVAPEIAPLEADDAVFHRTNLRTLRNTTLGNFLDLPGLAIPNGSDADGLPTSFLLCVQSGEDERLLGVGLAVEPLIRPG